MNEIYFEQYGADLLKKMGMRKSEFARQMGIHKQNVNSLFKTKNIETIRKAAAILNVPFELLVGYTEQPDYEFTPVFDGQEEYLISEGDIPSGRSVSDRRKRQRIIEDFYHRWKQSHPEQRKYNVALKDNINIRYVSIEETAAQASLTYLSTLAVLQLDAILTNAWLVNKVPSKANSKNQRPFESILIMEYICTGVGRVKMTVGIRRSDKAKVQYCITAIDAHKIKQEV